jgi:glycosyltransferase involved in cell wall biosynthesis
MRKVWMTPTPSEAAHDTTNAIHQIAIRMAKHLPGFGYEIVENPNQAELRVGHAGQGSDGNVDVAIYHGLYPTAQGFDGAYFAINSHVIHNLKTAKQIIAPSEWIADVIRRDMHVEPNIVPWGIDTEEWTPGDNPHVYAIWNKARVDKVCDPTIMQRLAARANNVPFLSTFGEPAPNVRVIGRRPYEEMKSLVRNAGVYLSTNVETFGLGILQACAAGVPVLGFRQAAIAEYLTHGVDSFLAEVGDEDGLYAGLAYCLKHRETLGRNARALAQRYSWTETARKMAAVFDKALEPHKGAKVSVIIPCHNYAEFVDSAIFSALNQETTFEYEIIVVLDRCTDDSPAVVAKYPAVKAIVADNGNLSATRNQGIAAATGEYIVCLDADDRLGDSRFLQILADALDQDRTLGIAFTGITIMDADGNLGHKNPWPSGYDFDQQAQRRNQVPSCCMFRKEAWRRAGGFRPMFKYAEDAEFWLTVGSLGYGGKQVTDQGWFHYRLHDKSASQVHRTGEIKEPDWTEFHPWTRDGQRPFAADGRTERGSWAVRFYHEPDVSIIIPVGKGHEQTLRDTLHSVEGQSHRFWECIVVNDTGAKLDLSGFPWAKAVNAPKPLGAGAARNVGANRANSAMLVFLDADDILKPAFLTEALKAYKEHGRYIYTDWLTDDGRGNVRRRETLDYTFESMRQYPSLHLVTTLIPRKWFQAVGGFDDSLTAFEDVDFFMKLYTYGYCGLRLAKPLVVYNLDAGQRRKSGDAQKDAFKALLIKRYGEYMETDRMCDCVEPPKGKKAVPPTPENVGEYKSAYGEMVKVEYVSQFAPVSPVTFYGPATRVNYGARALGDVFHIWQADLENSDGVFREVNTFEPERASSTVVPPAPAPVQTAEFPPLGDIDPLAEPDASEADTEPAQAAVDEPFDGWTHKQLDTYAKANGIDFAGARTIDAKKAVLMGLETNESGS